MLTAEGILEKKEKCDKQLPPMHNTIVHCTTLLKNSYVIEAEVQVFVQTFPIRMNGYNFGLTYKKERRGHNVLKMFYIWISEQFM